MYLLTCWKRWVWPCRQAYGLTVLSGLVWHSVIQPEHVKMIHFKDISDWLSNGVYNRIASLTTSYIIDRILWQLGLLSWFKVAIRVVWNGISPTRQYRGLYGLWLNIPTVAIVLRISGVSVCEVSELESNTLIHLWNVWKSRHIWQVGYPNVVCISNYVTALCALCLARIQLQCPEWWPLSARELQLQTLVNLSCRSCKVQHYSVGWYVVIARVHKATEHRHHYFIIISPPWYMALAVAEALNPNKPNQTIIICRGWNKMVIVTDVGKCNYSNPRETITWKCNTLPTGSRAILGSVIAKVVCDTYFIDICVQKYLEVPDKSTNC